MSLARSDTSSRPDGLGFVMAVLAAADAKLRERVRMVRGTGYFAVLVVKPLAELTLAFLIYHGHQPEIASYAAVGLAAGVPAYNCVFFLGVMTERERLVGTLTFLLLTPVSRLAWVSGYLLVGLLESATIVAVVLAFDVSVLGIEFNPGWPALAVVCAFYVISLWGFGIALSTLAVLAKKTSSVANLVFPFVTVLGGFYYPVAALPAWLESISRLLPFGVATRTLADASLNAATLHDLRPDLLELAVSAGLWCALGVTALRWIDHTIRVRGDVDVY